MTRRGGRTPGDAIDMAVDALAVYRATRLVTADTVTAPLRDAWIRRAYADAGTETNAITAMRGMNIDPHREGGWAQYAQVDQQPPKLATLVTCRFCAGVWMAGLAVLASYVAPGAWGVLRKVLALSAAGALIAAIED